MGRVFSALKREVVNYNVENRAHKVLSREKLPPAPQYESTLRDKQRLEEMGITVDDLVKKNMTLDENLKNIYVKSEGPPPPILGSRKLPTDRFCDIADMEYGYLEPETSTPGKISLKKALQLLSKHLDDKEKNNAVVLAKQYNLDVEVVGKIVDHFQIFRLYMPNNLEDKVKNPAKRLSLKQAVSNFKKLALVKAPKEEIIKPVKSAEKTAV